MLSENGVNTPFVVNAPGIVPKGKVSDALIDFSDLLPTFCDLAQTKPDEKSNMMESHLHQKIRINNIIKLYIRL